MENNRRYTDTAVRKLDEEMELIMDSHGFARRAAKEGKGLDQLPMRVSDTEQSREKLIEMARKETAIFTDHVITMAQHASK